MVDPMVSNEKFPTWSYINRDLSIVMTGIWIFLIWLSNEAIDHIFLHLRSYLRLPISITIASVFYIPLEGWFILNGFRKYGESAVANFSGYYSSVMHLPIEVIFAVRFYLCLMMCFVRFWEIVIDNKL